MQQHGYCDGDVRVGRFFSEVLLGELSLEVLAHDGVSHPVEGVPVREVDVELD